MIDMKHLRNKMKSINLRLVLKIVKCNHFQKKLVLGCRHLKPNILKYILNLGFFFRQNKYISYAKIQKSANFYRLKTHI